MSPYRFTVELYPDKEEGGYTAIVPSLPGCVTQGDTLDQTLERAREAIEGYIECLKEDGKEILKLKTIKSIIQQAELNIEDFIR